MRHCATVRLRRFSERCPLLGVKRTSLKEQGRSLDEIIAAKPTAAFDAKWGQFVITPAMFTRLVYEGA